MKYLLLESKVMNLMDEIFTKGFGIIELPLEKERIFGKGQKGYGSVGDEYLYSQTQYLLPDGRPLFTRYSDNHPYEDVSWELDDSLMQLYNIFDEKLLEEFVLWKFGIDLNDGKKKYNWLFR